MDQGTHQDTRKARELLLKDILQTYAQEVSPAKRSAQREAEGIDFMLRQKIAAYSMAALTPSVVAQYRDQRLKTVAPAPSSANSAFFPVLSVTHARNGD
jgi:hypothetical protein